MGGYVGQTYAERFPGKMQGFVSIDSAPSAKAVYHRFGNLAFKADGAGVPVFPLEAAAQMGERRGLHHGIWPRADAGDDEGLQLRSKALCGPFRAWLSDAGTGLRGGSALSVGVSGTADMRRAGTMRVPAFATTGPGTKTPACGLCGSKMRAITPIPTTRSGSTP